MKKIITSTLLFSAVALAGCAQVGGTLAEVGRPLAEKVTFTDDSWSKSQKNTNVQALVLYDEEYSIFRMHQLNVIAGVGAQEKAYRRVVLYIVHSEGGRPIGNYKGFMRFVAVVPDGMPLLKNGDLVEARVGNVYDYLKGFAQTGEGTAVLRILCPANTHRSQQERFKQCASELAWYKGWDDGQRYYNGIVAAASERPYLPKLSDHTELKFSPYYDVEGSALPQAAPPAARPDITTWPSPRKY